MGTLVVEDVPPSFKSGALLFDVGLGATFNFHRDVAVHAFVSAVLVRPGRGYAVEVYAEGHPPSRQPAQPQWRMGAGKGGTVVAAYGVWQAECLEQTLELMTYRNTFGISERVGAQHEPAEIVAYGQGFAPLPVAGIPPALKVARPQIIGGVGNDSILYPATTVGRFAPAFLTKPALSSTRLNVLSEGNCSVGCLRP